MQLHKQRMAVVLVAAGLGLVNTGVRAQEPLPPEQDRTIETDRNTYKSPESESYNRSDYARPADTSTQHGQHIRASKLIGKEVKNDQGERLGKIEDLVINSSHTVNFAILSAGGALGIGDKHIAVPINDLSCSGDGARLSASKEQLKNASKTPTGAWMAYSGQEWTRDIDGYYGQPQEFSMSEPRGYSQPARAFERETFTFDSSLDRESVRAEQGNGARQLINHPDHANLFKEPLIGKGSSESREIVVDTSDEAMQQRVCDNLQETYAANTAQAVSVTVENGVVTLRGTVDNAAEKRNVENTVKEMNGVRRVNNQLTTQSR